MSYRPFGFGGGAVTVLAWFGSVVGLVTAGGSVRGAIGDSSVMELLDLSFRGELLGLVVGNVLPVEPQGARRIGVVVEGVVVVEVRG